MDLQNFMRCTVVQACWQCHVWGLLEGRSEGKRQNKDIQSLILSIYTQGACILEYISMLYGVDDNRENDVDKDDTGILHVTN